ncbi:MAG: HNH endonuclease [Hydrococcus sp. RU_2_2]|nr:HNH endonuclease [Hydrococcus sp. RU_2_2]
MVFGRDETNNCFRQIYEHKAIDFANDLLEYSKTYINLKQGKSPEGERNRHLENINLISSTLKMHLMLLLSGKHLSSELFLKLSKQVEDIVFVYFIVDESKPEQEKHFTRWCQEIRNLNNDEELSKFIECNIKAEKSRVSERLEQALNKIEYKSRGRSNALVRYVLAKLSQYINEEAWKRKEELAEHYNKQIEIEHILPQNPEEKIKHSFDKPNEINKYINRLGNLTLLERQLNSSCKNKSFSEKKISYSNSNYLLTKTIVTKDGFGKNTSMVRAIDNLNLETFTEWNSQSIESRQKMLVELAKKVWDIFENLSILASEKTALLLPLTKQRSLTNP